MNFRSNVFCVGLLLGLIWRRRTTLIGVEFVGLTVESDAAWLRTGSMPSIVPPIAPDWKRGRDRSCFFNEIHPGSKLTFTLAKPKARTQLWDGTSTSPNLTPSNLPMPCQNFLFSVGM
jgi:hypothetical protein